MGLGDLEVAPYQYPPLTTVRQSVALLATRARAYAFRDFGEREPVETQVVSWRPHWSFGTITAKVTVNVNEEATEIANSTANGKA